MQSRSIVLTALIGLVAFGLTACGSQPESKVGFKVEKEASSKQSEAETAVSKAASKFTAVRVYTDANSPDNHYVPSGYMGDYGDLTVKRDHFENPHSGSTCIKIIYSGKASQGAGWAGIYWQNPANNWGGRPGGINLTGAKKLVFWARGENGGEKVEEFRCGGMPGEYADSDVAGIGPVILTKEWKKYEIDLSDHDMSSIIGGFMWSASQMENREGFTFYLDDIAYQ